MATWARRPSRITATWSASDSASPWSWVTRTAVAPAARSARTTARPVPSRRPASSDENGSSSSTTAGLGGQRPGQRDPLLLAAGELVRVAAARGSAARLDQVEQLGDAGAARARARGSPKAMLARDVEVREQRALLRHVADPAPLRRQGPTAVADHRLPAEADRPRRRGRRSRR